MASNNTSVGYNSTSAGFTITDLSLLPAYCLAISVGLGGNGLVIGVVRKKRSLHTTTNYLLANLALADLLNLIWCIPGLVLTFVEHPRGTLGDLLCKFVTMHHIAGIMQIVSGLTLTILAVERYNALFHPMDTRLRLRRENLRYPIGIMWSFSVIYVIPLFVYEKYSAKENNCSLVWPNWQVTGMIYWGVLAVIVLLCSITMLYCYFNIIKGLYFTQTICSRGQAPNGDERAAKRKIVKLLLSVTLVFCVCFIPFIVVSVVFTDGSHSVAYKLSYFLVYCSSSVNPLIYAYYSSNYRNAFSEVLERYSQRIRNLENHVPRIHRHASSFELKVTENKGTDVRSSDPKLLSFKRI
ncbi:predicted protein [Nematostella vectensis]|uniref:G-protein coupled receptors family 1 profile domain-containing protein n=1 Tax=Nematostella vectensis TaxID=45351 RepID=A7RYR4_NEMVE|nr:somatostatin receptor type 5 [Nematostella vectensis]XP_032240924.1 somatostatin receptor type 5 [Nematostella vectensis]XP_048587535.1 somatostatin receptor type 5 [Nematostella vectensis]XP_048587536.1 somatostatin receptor type 5 [Nematostella vectensis]EDO43365.1 predicted protein [Nematostella vectensis]|eukprot:XP_001635428.1 predicted protein [Nematostella vectensis]